MKEMNTKPGLTRRRYCLSCDNLNEIQPEEVVKRSPKPGFLQRVFFKRKYGPLKRSKSAEKVSEALNISIEDAKDKQVRDRSRTVPSEMWAENEEKTKRRGAVCEENEEKREEFTKILETFMIQKNMDDYGF